MAVVSNCRVVAIDVGSVRGKFHWAGLDLPNRELVGTGDTPEGAALAVSEALSAGVPVALGFESPIMVPVPLPASPDGWRDLGRARQHEGSRSWSAGAGSGALATGLVEMAWVLDRLAGLHPTLSATTRPERWQSGAPLLIWEAFVSGPGKPVPGEVSQHAADAAAAADTFAERWESDTLDGSDVECAPHGSFNLAAAAALYAGLGMDVQEIRYAVSVLRTPPALPAR